MRFQTIILLVNDPAVFFLVFILIQLMRSIVLEGANMPEAIQPWRQRTTSLTKTEVITAYLQEMALPSMWPRVLSEADYELWDLVLEGYSVPAIRFSFDNWITGGRRFPVPADITPLCISYQEQEEQARNPKGPQRGESLTGGQVAIFTLLQAIIERKDKFAAENRPYEKLTDEDIDKLVLEVKSGKYKPAPKVHAKYFPNGNARYNRELTQARALLQIPVYER